MKLFHTFAKYVTFNVLGMLALSCYILADTFFIAQGLGADGLTSLNLAIPVYSFINGCGLMVGIGGSTRYSIFKASGKDSEASQIFTHSLILSAVIAFLFVFIGCFFTQELTLFLGADEMVFDMTFIYLKIMLFFSPAFILNNIMNAFVRNDGNPGLAMTAMISGSLANILFDYILIFPCGLGMKGAILATGFSPLFGLLILSRHFASDVDGLSNIRIVRVTPSLSNTLDICALGVSSLIAEVASGVVIIIFNLIILDLSGNIGVAAYSIIANLSLVVTAIFTGIAQGLQPIFSQAHGNGLLENIRSLFKYGIILSLALSVLIYLLFIVESGPIISVFNENSNPTLTRIAKDGIQLYFTAFAFAGVNIISATLLSSTDNPHQAFLLSSLRGFVIIIPCIIGMALLWEMTGVWMSFPVAEGLTMLITLWIICGYFSEGTG